MKRITLIAITAATLSFAATPAFAQSSYGGNSGNSYGNTTSGPSSADIRRAKKAAKAQAKIEKTRAEAEARLAKSEDVMKKEHSSATDAKVMKDHSSATDAKVMTDHSSATDAKVMKEHSSATDAKMMKDHSSATDAAMMKKDDVMMKEEKMMKASAALPTNCPSGTTPQSNGTCMLN